MHLKSFNYKINKTVLVLALYDKRNPFYKDKQYSERAWNDISMKLGYKGKSFTENV